MNNTIPLDPLSGPSQRKRKNTPSPILDDMPLPPFGPPNWYALDRARRGRPQALVAQRRRIYQLPSTICLWLQHAMTFIQRSCQPPGDIRGHDRTFTYLLFYDEVQCIISMDIQVLNCNFQQQILILTSILGCRSTGLPSRKCNIPPHTSDSNARRSRLW